MAGAFRYKEHMTDELHELLQRTAKTLSERAYGLLEDGDHKGKITLSQTVPIGKSGCSVVIEVIASPRNPLDRIIDVLADG